MDFILGLITGLGPLVLALIGIGLFAVWIISLRRVVPTNMVHIVQGRKNTTPYGRGKTAGNVYYEWPSWLPIVGVVVSKFPESVFDISLNNYEAYDSGRVPFVVDVKAFFRVEDAPGAAQRVESFAQLREQLQAVLQGAVRRILATNLLESIMQDRSQLGEQFTEEVNEQLKEWGVTTVKSIEFMDLRDSAGSKVIANIMAKEESRIERDSRMAVADNKKQAELREIEARREVDLQEQQALQAVGIRTAEKEKEVGIAQEQSQQEVLEQGRVTAEKEMAVKLVNDVKTAEIAREVAVVKAEQDQRVMVVTAEAEKKKVEIGAEAERNQTEQIALGQLAAAKNEAEGTLAKGKAEAEAEKLKLMAPVNAQLELAREIGSNEGYQGYLVQVESIKAGQAVGTSLAEAIGQADIKIIANAGDVQGGVASVGDLFSARGGTNMTAMLEALAQSPIGKQLVDRVTGHVEEPPTPPAAVMTKKKDRSTSNNGRPAS